MPVQRLNLSTTSATRTGCVASLETSSCWRCECRTSNKVAVIGDSLARFAIAHPPLREAGLWASMRIVEKAEEFAAANGKQLLWILSYNVTTVAETLRQGTRFDREFIDFMKQNGLCHVDLLKAHQVDFASFNGDVDEYLKQYYIGHYNTAGNVFTASAMVEELAEMLDPGPALNRSST